jgi:hypothetical protein
MNTPAPKRRRRWLKLAIAAVLALVALWLILPYAMAPLISEKLRDLVSQHLNAELHIGSLRYEFPYGVRVRNLSIVATKGNVELFAVDDAELSLTQLPLRPGPLLIQKVTLDRPTLRIVRSQDGSMMVHDLVKPTPTTAKPQQKLSDVFRLRLLAMQGGRVRYEDRTADSSGPPSLIEWSNLQTTLHLTPRSSSKYGWDFTSDSGPVAKVSSEGTFDVDELVAEVSKLSIEARADPNTPATALPASVQETLRAMEIEGTAKLDATAKLSLRDLRVAEFKATLQLPDVRARPGGSPVGLSLQLDIEKRADDPTIALRVQNLSADTEAGVIASAGAQIRLDAIAMKWSVNDLAARLEPAKSPGNSGAVTVSGSISGTGRRIDESDLRAVLDDLSLAINEFDRPLEHLKGTIRATGGEIVAENISGMLGADQLTLTGARAPLSGLSKGLAIHDIVFAADLQQPGPRYPRALGKVMEELGPVGRFDVRGNWTIVPGAPDDYELTLSTRGGALAPALGEGRVPITNLWAETTLTRQLMQIRRFTGNSFDGTVSASGTIVPVKPMKYDGEIGLQNVDIAQVAKTFVIPSGKDANLSGRANAKITLRGEGPDPAGLSGHGEVQITEGRLWEIPLLKSIVSATKVTSAALVASNAAAVMDFGESKVQLRRAAINSPALGLQGSGTVGFDRTMDLDVTAALFGDWKQHVKKTGIPLVSSVVGELAGGVQKLVNTATSQLLYAFHVTGKTGDPQVQAVPTPILTETAAALFGKMFNGEKDLLDAMHEKPKQ